MAHQWRGVIREYAERLPSLDGMPVVTLLEGGTPLIPAEHLSSLVGAEVWLKFEGLNPTGSFKDRGMTTAISVAAGHGAKAVICASTGNTSASAAAYAAKAGMTCGVLVPEGKIAMGKLSQAIAHGATLLQVDGNFDDCLNLARKLAEAYPVDLVNSVNPARIEGQKTAAFEVVDALGDAPDIHCLPVGNAGNITAYWLGYQRVPTGLGATRPCYACSENVGLPGRRGRPDRARAPGRRAGDRRHGHPDREPRLVEAGRGGTGRVRWPHPRGHRRADPRGAPPGLVRGRRLRRARRRPRRSPACSRRTRPASSPPGPGSSAPSPDTASRTRSGPCGRRTGPTSSRSG